MITKTIRLSEETNKMICEKANELGISQNSLMIMLIDIGAKFYNSKINPQCEGDCSYTIQFPT